jgi:hypothetical protein
MSVIPKLSVSYRHPAAFASEMETNAREHENASTATVATFLPFLGEFWSGRALPALVALGGKHVRNVDVGEGDRINPPYNHHETPWSAALLLFSCYSFTTLSGFVLGPWSCDSSKENSGC